MKNRYTEFRDQMMTKGRMGKIDYPSYRAGFDDVYNYAEKCFSTVDTNVKPEIVDALIESLTNGTAPCDVDTQFNNNIKTLVAISEDFSFVKRLLSDPFISSKDFDAVEKMYFSQDVAVADGKMTKTDMDFVRAVQHAKACIILLEQIKEVVTKTIDLEYWRESREAYVNKYSSIKVDDAEVQQLRTLVKSMGQLVKAYKGFDKR